MLPNESDAAYLWDIMEAAQLIRGFISDISAPQYLADKKSQLAVERAVEIIGEAARRLSDAFRQAHPEIPWASIIAQRNVIAHEYGEIKQERMWNIATKRVPALVSLIEPLIPSPPKD
jgi:uncharacterized protein with HEPN domain